MNLQYSIKQICSILNVPEPEGEDVTLLVQNVVIDSRSPRINSSTLFVALGGLKQDGHEYVKKFGLSGGKVALVSQKQSGVKCMQIIVDNTLLALQKLAKYHRAQFNYPVIGITGSNGKTIVKEWLNHVLRGKFSIVRSPKSYNSQIGVALSILEMSSENNLAIFEAGISQPGEMQVLKDMIMPTIGVFTGLGDAHGVNFESNEQKKAEKMILFSDAIITFSSNPQAAVFYEIPFHDEASVMNANLVSQVAQYFELKDTELTEKMRTLPTISMRLEQVQGSNNCLLLNDAYTADFAALEIALRHLTQIAAGRKKVLILNLSEQQLALNENDALADLIYTASLNEIVFIGSENLLEKSRIAGKYYKSLDEFLKSPPVFEGSVILFKGSRSNSLEKLVMHYAAKKHVTQLEVNLAAMRHNLNYFRSNLAPNVKCLAMVKAQSYGSGLVETASFLQTEGVDYLGVAYADEGVELRKAGITLPILVMNPEESAFDEIIDFELEPSIYSTDLLQKFLHHLILRQVVHFPIHLKLESGLNRLGFTKSDLNELISILKTQPEVFIKSAFSHFSVADTKGEEAFTNQQIEDFEEVTSSLLKQLNYSFDRHISNSAATLNYPKSHFEMIRLGIGLYGLLKEHKLALENVLSFHTQISQIKELKAGDSVGYGRSFIADAKKRIAIVPVGYADGLNRKLGHGNWSFIVNGKKVKSVGTICMDMCTIDITEVEAKVGDSVQIFGIENSIFEMADCLETIPYEIISGISSRVHRVYLD